MIDLSIQDKKFLLNLSRKALEYYFLVNSYLDASSLKVSKNLQKKAGTFVTLYKKGNLRGCIGNIEPIFPIYKSVLYNTYSASFEDPRFDPLQFYELNDINIQISILTPKKPLEFTDTKDLLSKLESKKPGVVLQYGEFSATYLPEVWEHFSNARDFLLSLCKKAGLNMDCTKLPIKIYTYDTIKFSEKDF